MRSRHAMVLMLGRIHRATFILRYEVKKVVDAYPEFVSLDNAMKKLDKHLPEFIDEMREELDNRP